MFCLRFPGPRPLYSLESLLTLLITTLGAAVYGWIEQAFNRSIDVYDPSRALAVPELVEQVPFIGHFSLYQLFGMVPLFFCIGGGLAWLRSLRFREHVRRIYFVLLGLVNIGYAALIQDWTYFVFHPTDTLDPQDWTNWIPGLGFFIGPYWIPLWYVVMGLITLATYLYGKYLFNPKVSPVPAGS